jgi:hypothetical protein
MHKFKFGFSIKKLFRICILTSTIIFSFYYFILSGCNVKKDNIVKQDDFSSGLANRDPKLEEGLLYIETENIQEAKKFFKNLGKENPRHCGYLIGLPLVQIQEYLSKLSAIINFVVSVYGSGSAQGDRQGSPIIDEALLIFSPKLLPKQVCDNSLDRLIREFVSSLHTDTEEGLRMLEQAISQNVK